MSPRDWKLRIRDIIEAIQVILGYTRGYRFEDLAADMRTMDAVIWRFVIIGEAATHVPEEICRKHPEIPWRKMRGMRNYIIHVYHRTSSETIWETITDDLPPLIPRLEELLKE